MEWNLDSQADAQSLLLAIFQFSFIVALKAISFVLSFSSALRVKLQGQCVGIVYV